jgi:hypothetical protein
VFRFRYRIYVEEMHRQQSCADHERKHIRDYHDEDALSILAGFDQAGQIVGTVRANWANDLTQEDQLFYGMHAFLPYVNRRATLTSRFMVEQSIRGTSLALRLAIAIFELGYRAGSRFDFIDCNDHLVSFFMSLGYRQIIPDAIHPDYGRVHPMVLSVAGWNYLEKMRSPFAALKDTLPHDSNAEEFASSVLPDVPAYESIVQIPRSRRCANSDSRNIARA